MSFFINNQQNINEVIFANRNKQYGAYAIRSVYGTTIFKSIMIMILFSATALSLAYYFSHLPEKSALAAIDDKDRDKDSVFTINVDVSPEIKVPETVQPKSDGASAASSGSVEIKDVVTSETVAVSGHTGTGTGPSTSTATGTEGTTTATSSVSENTGNKPETIHAIAETQPEFEGGLKALYAFISSNIVYPAVAKSEGQSGTVVVRFVVDQKGKIGHVTLMKGAGYGFDEEAKRVIELLPPFKKPGTVAGEPVKVFYHLPIKFKMN